MTHPYSLYAKKSQANWEISEYCKLRYIILWTMPEYPFYSSSTTFTWIPLKLCLTQLCTLNFASCHGLLSSRFPLFFLFFQWFDIEQKITIPIDRENSTRKSVAQKEEQDEDKDSNLFLSIGVSFICYPHKSFFWKFSKRCTSHPIKSPSVSAVARYFSVSANNKSQTKQNCGDEFISLKQTQKPPKNSTQVDFECSGKGFLPNEYLIFLILHPYMFAFDGIFDGPQMHPQRVPQRTFSTTFPTPKNIPLHVQVSSGCTNAPQTPKGFTNIFRGLLLTRGEGAEIEIEKTWFFVFKFALRINFDWIDWLLSEPF